LSSRYWDSVIPAYFLKSLYKVLEDVKPTISAIFSIE
jgi:hypothetical protein